MGRIFIPGDSIIKDDFNFRGTHMLGEEKTFIVSGHIICVKIFAIASTDVQSLGTLRVCSALLKHLTRVGVGSFFCFQYFLLHI